RARSRRARGGGQAAPGAGGRGRHRRSDARAGGAPAGRCAHDRDRPQPADDRPRQDTPAGRRPHRLAAGRRAGAALRRPQFRRRGLPVRRDVLSRQDQGLPGSLPGAQAGRRLFFQRVGRNFHQRIRRCGGAGAGEGISAGPAALHGAHAARLSRRRTYSRRARRRRVQVGVDQRDRSRVAGAVGARRGGRLLPRHAMAQRDRGARRLAAGKRHAGGGAGAGAPLRQWRDRGPHPGDHGGRGALSSAWKKRPVARHDRACAAVAPVGTAVERHCCHTGQRSIAAMTRECRMTSTQPAAPAHDPIETKLSSADDRVLLNDWLPPQIGVVPKIRIGRHWINVLWVVPIGFVVALIGVAAAQALRELPAVQEFIVRYPGIPRTALAVTDGFPAWLRVQHFLNLLFMAFIIRSGIQVLADHPRLYWKRDCTPGTEWFRFQKAVPTGRIWPAKDDSVTLPGWLGIPGIRHSVGLARWWHFSFGLLWIINGVVIYVLLFWTDQWQRLVPTTWEVFPNAVSTALQYLSLSFPADESW